MLIAHLQVAQITFSFQIGNLCAKILELSQGFILSR